MADLKKIFQPSTIALIGASDREGAISRAVFENLARSKGIDLFPVNPRRTSVFDLECFPDIASVPRKVDLAVIATPAPTVPGLVEECGKAGVEGVIIPAEGFRETGPEGVKLEEQILEVKKRYGMRVIGPNSLGFIRPHLGLNTTPLQLYPERGNIAFISQSGAFGRALLDWAIDAHVGLSMSASLGGMLDVDFGDLIDFLGYDPHTRSIILYMEDRVGNVKKFVSAARGFARNKPIVVLKPSGIARRDCNAPTHTGQMVESDRVHDAVFKRVGVVRVKAVTDLFNTAGVLYSKHLPKGPRLAIITNAAGVGLMAKHALAELGGRLARLSEQTVAELKTFLPHQWHDHNPIDVVRDADTERYLRTIKLCLNDEGADGVMVIYTPQGVAAPGELAEAVTGVANAAWKPVITVWMGGKEVREAREIFSRNNVASYETPEEAVRTYLYMYSYERNLELLYETPEDVPVDQAPPKNHLKALIRKIIASGRTMLTEEESKRFLVNYGIPVTKTITTSSAAAAAVAARSLGYPVVLKVVSPDIPYKSDVGGVTTGITSEQELTAEFERLFARVTDTCPGCTIEGVSVQRQIEKIDYEIILGAKKDEEFGSVILFGMGGTPVQIFGDVSVGLPPLNQTLARRLMEETKVYRMIQGYRGKPPADLKQLEQIIMGFSNMIVDFPEIAEVDINPIALCDGKAYALDAKIIIDKNCLNPTTPYPHLIITPYPTRYIMHWRLRDGTEVLLRPIKPEDEPMEHEMLMSLSEQTLRERFFQAIKHITHEMHVRFCNIDYDREMAIVAEIKQGEKRRIIGIGRLISEPDSNKGEFAVVVHDDFHGHGLGRKLVDIMIGIGQEKAVDEVYGVVLSTNYRMLNMCSKLGFAIEPLPDDITRVSLPLK